MIDRLARWRDTPAAACTGGNGMAATAVVSAVSTAVITASSTGDQAKKDRENAKEAGKSCTAEAFHGYFLMLTSFTVYREGADTNDRQ